MTASKTSYQLTHTTASEAFSYNPKTGILSWNKERPEYHFKRSKDKKTWEKQFGGKVAGSSHSGGYLTVWVFGKHQFAHRIIWLILYGYLPTHEIDHIDGCRQNNRAENLREVSHTDNARNASQRKDNKSGVSGVHWSKTANKWVVQIRDHGKARHVGFFERLEDAAVARKTANQKYGYHGGHGKQKQRPRGFWLCP